MLVLGLQGSPRKKGNTNYLLTAFMAQAAEQGARTHVIPVTRKQIKPCIGCGHCEKHGVCITTDDDMAREIYTWLREAEVVVAATPIYFYNTTAQLKLLIDRSQALWSRKYRLNLEDPGRRQRRGFLLALGATKGQNLFEGVHLTAKYFFDAVGADYHGSLTYWRVEHPGDMQNHGDVDADVATAVAGLLKPYQGRRKILFACRENAGRSQMAGAFAQILGGTKIDAATAGSAPAEKVNPLMVEAMQEIGIDMGFKKPRLLQAAIDADPPEMIITMGCGEECPFVPGARRLDWDLPDPAGQSIEFVRTLRDEIQQRVKALIDTLA